MELFLNLVWLALAILSFAIAERQRRRGTVGAHKWSTIFIALACVMVLLFPAISLSDDYHSEMLLLDDSAKRISTMIDAPQAPILLVALLSGIVALLATMVVQSLSVEAAVQNTQDGFFSVLIGRAPPSLA